MMKRLRVVAFRYVLPLVPIPVFWGVWSLNSSLSPIIVGMFFAAIIGGVVALWHPTDYLSRKRVVMVIALLGLLAWLVWVCGLWFWYPTSDTSILGILAWPNPFDPIASGLSEVPYWLFLCLVGTAVLILPPAMALSILGHAVLPRVKADVAGTHPLTIKQRLIASVLLLILAMGAFYVIALFVEPVWEDLFSIIAIPFLVATMVLGYLLRPTNTRWLNNWIGTWIFSTLLLGVLVLQVALPLNPSRSLPLWLNLVERVTGEASVRVTSAFVIAVVFYLLMIVGGIAFSVLFSAFRRVGPWRPISIRRLCLVVGAFVVAILVFATSAGTYSRMLGGISAYNGETWRTFPFAAQASEGVSLNNIQDILEDSHGYLWIGGSNGVSRYDGTRWEKIESTSEVDSLPLYNISRMLEDAQGRVWFAGFGALTMYDGKQWKQWTEPFQVAIEGGSRLLEITALTEDRNGRIWMTVGEGGAWYMDNMKLQQLGGTKCADSVYTGNDGNLWFYDDPSHKQSDQGCPSLLRYDGDKLESFVLENSLPPNGITAITQDRRGRVWIGVLESHINSTEPAWYTGGVGIDQYWYTGGVAVYADGLWRTISDKDAPQAPIHFIFEDSQTNLWFGTWGGLFRYDDLEGWSRLPGSHESYIPTTRITEDSKGNLWVGTSQGLIRYNRSNDKLDTFTSLNSGLVVDVVKRLFIDRDGVLWVAASETRTVGRAPWLAVFLALIFCLGTPTLLYRRYDKQPSTKALRLAREVDRQPDQLYAVYYGLLASTPDSGAVLQNTDTFGRFRWAALPAALAPLAQQTDSPVSALEKLLAALESGIDQQDRDRLWVLYRFLLEAAKADSPAAIARLEVAIDPTPEGAIVTTRDGVISHLPDFLSPELPEALVKIQTTIGDVRKYLDIDSMSDKLSYLAASLSTVEELQTQAGGMPAPDGPILAAIASSWRSVIARDLKRTSGQTQLEVALRSRRALLGEYITVVFAVSNRGRATATNVILTLSPSDDYEVVGEGQFRQERLSSAQSALSRVHHQTADNQQCAD